MAPGYWVREHLRRGNIYDVCSVWSQQRDCLCIAKLPRPDRVSQERVRQRLVLEGRALTGFSHPHIVRAYELLDADEVTGPILILETLNGMTLSRLIQEQEDKRLHRDDVAQLARQLCSALHYLHEQGWIHLDLKPSNIVNSGGRAVLLDMGQALPPGPGKARAGTVQYMAPEQWRGGAIGPAADIWGMGSIMYRALTGHRPFSGSAADCDNRGEVDLDRLQRQQIHEAWAKLVRDCLQTDPEARPDLPTVRQRLDELCT